MTNDDALTWESTIGPALQETPPPEKAPSIPEDEAETAPERSRQTWLAEVGLLGALMIEPSAWAAAQASGIKLEDFSIGAHKTVFRAIAKLYEAGRPVDTMLVAQALSRRGQLAGVGGDVALCHMVDSCPTASYAADYAREVSEAAQRRRLGYAANEWAEAASRGVPGPELLAKIGKVVEKEKHGRVSADLDGVSLSALSETAIDPDATLLGTDGVRYLCRGGCLLFVGPSGVGKSTSSAQQDILWALGRPAFGIAPARPLRIVTVQAENDTGDLVYMAKGIMDALALDEAARGLVDANTRYLSHNQSTGGAFLAFLERVLQTHQPDLLRIDPLMAYAGGDLTKPETIAAFCRNGLNPLATRHRCGMVVCHHTPKQNSTGANAEARKSWGAFDWQYAAAGGADLANWARAMLVIEPLSRNLFAFRAAKRWPGWRDPGGAIEHVRHFRRENEHGRPYWHDATPEEAFDAAKDRPIADGKRGAPKKNWNLARCTAVEIARECVRTRSQLKAELLQRIPEIESENQYEDNLSSAISAAIDSGNLEEIKTHDGTRSVLLVGPCDGSVRARADEIEKAREAKKQRGLKL